MNNVKHTRVLACRVCLTTKYEAKVTMNCENGLLKKFEYCFGLQIEPDHRSRTLCKPCADNMKKFAEFKKKCLKSDAIWKSNLLLTSDLEIKYINTENAQTILDSSDNEHEVMKEESFDDLFESDTETNNYSAIQTKTTKPKFKKARNSERKIITRSKNTPQALNPLPSNSEKVDPSYSTVKENRITSNYSTIQEEVTSQKLEAKIETKENESDDDISFEEFAKKYEKQREMKKKKQALLKELKRKSYRQIVDSESNLMNTNHSNKYIKFGNETEENEKIKAHENQKENPQNNMLDMSYDMSFEDFLKERGKQITVSEEDAVFCKCGKKFYTKKNITFHTKKCKIYKFYNCRGVILHTKCGICDFSAEDVDTVRKHWDEHFQRNDVDCQLCDFSGRDFAEMTRHRYSHQDGKTTLYCHICRRIFHEARVLEFHFRSVHMKMKGGLCTYCGKELESYKGWIKHELRVHSRDRYGEQRDIYICDCCGLKFLYRGSIITHLLAREGLNKCVCDTCGASFSRQSNLNSHIKCKHMKPEMAKCPQCPSIVRKYLLKKHIILIHGDKKFVCEICSASFTTFAYLKYHMMQHTNIRPFQCDMCQISYKLKSQLKKHIMVKHAGLKPHKCKECHKGFGTSVQLRRHIMLVHTKIKPFKCGQCDKSFYCKYLLRKHRMKKHVDVSNEFEMMLV